MFFIPHIALIQKHKFKLIVGALVFWILMGLFVYLTEWVATHFFGAPIMDAIEEKQYLLRWIVWFVLTPFIVLLGLKINVGNCKIGWFVLLHILFGTIILSIEFFVELAILKPMAEQFYNRSVEVNELVLPFLNKYFGYILNYFLIIGIVNMFVYMNSLNETKQNLLQTELQNNNLKYELALAQIQSLKMQIQPHFLFNAHQSIIGLIIQHKNEQAIEMLGKLSNLLRVTLEKQHTEFVTLEEEIQIVEMYLDIQKVRFGDRINYIKSVSENCQNKLVPFFILQPLIENAIKYGVELTDENVEIEICGNVKNDQLIIEVKNSTIESSHHEQGFGIGLKNTQQRLFQHYNENASIELLQTETFTISKLTIPIYE